MSKIQLGMLVLDSETWYSTAPKRLHLKLMGMCADLPVGGRTLQMPRLYLYQLLVITRQQIVLEKIQAHQCLGYYIQIAFFWIVYTWMTNLEYKHDGNDMQNSIFSWSKLPKTLQSNIFVEAL